MDKVDAPTTPEWTWTVLFPHIIGASDSENLESRDCISKDWHLGRQDLA